MLEGENHSSLAPRDVSTGAGAVWWPLPDDEAPDGHLQPVKRGLSHRLRDGFIRYGRTFLVFLPTWGAIAYFGLIAADRYESEAMFIVRTASKPAASLGTFGAFLQMSGLARSQDDVFAVQSYLNSREAVRELGASLPLREMYSRPEADLIGRFPSFYSGATDEDLYRYLRWMIDVKVNEVSSVTTLNVQAFRADDAQKVAEALLRGAERKINSINERLQSDAVRVAEHEVELKQDMLVAAQMEITKFRNKEMLIDPARSSLIVSEVIGRLTQKLAEVELNIRDTSTNMPDSPVLAGYHANADALRKQIEAARAKIAGKDSGLAEKLAEYEALNLKRGFAEHALTSANGALESATQEARRQQLYLERIVEPHAADRATMPSRWRGILTVFVSNVLALMMLWLVVSGVGEHAAEKKV